MSNFTKWHLTHEFCFRTLSAFFTILVRFDIYFLSLPWEIVFGVIILNYFFFQGFHLKFLPVFKFFAWVSGDVKHATICIKAVPGAQLRVQDGKAFFHPRISAQWKNQNVTNTSFQSRCQACQACARYYWYIFISIPQQEIIKVHSCL